MHSFEQENNEQEVALAKINEKILENEEEMIQTLQEVVAIRSVEEPGVDELPFGAGVEEALLYMLNKANVDGFQSLNVDHYGGHIEFGGTIYNEQGEVVGFGEETMGILGHLDVVPEGNDWDYDPYGGEIIDGKMYGRGTTDDKGPILAAYYALRAIRDAGYEPQKKVRLVLGLDEETNWKGMDYYTQKVPSVDFGFTPDSKFPVVHGEMGLLVFEVAKKINKSVTKGLRFRSVTGGMAPNMVADFAKILVRGDSYDKLKEQLKAFKNETGYSLTARQRGKSLEIEAKGKSAHGATPWKGLNAISILMEFAQRMGFANEDICDFIDFYNEYIGFETNGMSLGCGLSDDVSGDLILNVGIAKMDEEAARLLINVRYPVTITEEQVFAGMKTVAEKYNLGIVKREHKEPIYKPTDDPIILTLMDVYQKHTDDYESKPLVTGGATYARSMPNIIAFGGLFPDETDRMHQINECISLDSLRKMTQIYAEAIFRLTDVKKRPVKSEILSL